MTKNQMIQRVAKVLNGKTNVSVFTVNGVAVENTYKVEYFQGKYAVSIYFLEEDGEWEHCADIPEYLGAGNIVEVCMALCVRS